MADINVERKGPSVWPWIIGLIVLALLIWLLTELFSDDADTAAVVTDPVATEPMATTPPTDPTMTAAAGMENLPAEVQTYLTSCTEQGGTPAGDMAAEHQFTVSCFEQLHAAMNAVSTTQATTRADATAPLETMHSSVQQLQASDPSATNHSNLTRDAATSAANAFQAIRGGTAGTVQQSAEGIQADTQLLQQRDAVHNFFREAGNELRSLAAAGGATR